MLIFEKMVSQNNVHVRKLDNKNEVMLRNIKQF